MRHLMRMVTNDADHESAKYVKIPNKGGTRKETFVAYKINGFWFYLSRKMWANFREIGYNTLCGRMKTNKTTAQVLGFEKVKKNTFAKGNTNGKDYFAKRKT